MVQPIQADQDSTEALAYPQIYKPRGDDWQQLKHVLLPIAEKIQKIFKDENESNFEELDVLNSFAHDFDEAAGKLKMHLRHLISNKVHTNIMEQQ